MLCSQSDSRLESRRLAFVHAGVAVRVVAHQHLEEGRIEFLDVLPEVVSILEVELVLTALLGGHGEDQLLFLRLAEDVAPELLVDEDPGCVAGGTGVQSRAEALVDQSLRVRDRLGLLRGGISGYAEHLLLERAAVVERQDVQLACVSKVHVEASSGIGVGWWSGERRVPLVAPRVQ